MRGDERGDTLVEVVTEQVQRMLVEPGFVELIDTSQHPDCDIHVM